MRGKYLSKDLELENKFWQKLSSILIISSGHMVWHNYWYSLLEFPLEVKYDTKHEWGNRNYIVGKSLKNNTDKNSGKEIAQEQKFKICLKIAWNTIKSMFDHP